MGQHTCMHIITSMSYIQYVCVMLYCIGNWRGICTKSHVGVITGYITPDQSAALEKCVAAWEGWGRGGVPHPIDWEPVIASPIIQQTKFERSTDSCFYLYWGSCIGVACSWINRMSWLLMYLPLVQTHLCFQPVSTACGCRELIWR